MKKLKYPAFLLAILITNCQSFNSFVQEPRLSFNSMEIAGINFNGVNLIAHVDVENPNAFSIPLPKIDWELFINTASFISGTLKNDKTLKKQETVTVDIPLSVTYEGLYKSISSLIATHEAAYHITLGISFPIPIIESKVYKLDFSGVIPLPRLPKLSPGSVKISKIDFTGIELSCGINVENPNSFAIPFPAMNWDYDVNGVPLIKSSFTANGDIAAGAAGAALITVGVAYADIFRAIGSAVNSSEAKSNLALSTGLPIPALENSKSVLDIPITLPILRAPEISFQGITRKSVSTTLEFVLNWEITNKNNFNFGVAEFNYDFMLNNNPLAKGSIKNSPELKAGGKTIIPVTVSVSALSLASELISIISRGSSANYSCSGNMALTSSFPGLDRIVLPLNSQGSTRIQ